MRQNYKFLLLAPPNTAIANSSFGKPRKNEQLHSQYLAAMQRLRGQVYLKDGAIQACELDDDGRFHMRGDEQGWHLLLVDDAKQVIGCARYLVHPNTVSFHKLRLSHSALAQDPIWGSKVRQAVENDLAYARKNDLSFIEIGGWALAEEWRNTRAALEILVGSYALGHMWGGCIGACTATARHGSSSMLRRLGGSSFVAGSEELPSYEDPQYSCRMELLRFDWRTPAARFAPLVSQLKAKLADVVPVTPEPVRDWLAFPREVGAAQLGLLRMAPLYS